MVSRALLIYLVAFGLIIPRLAGQNIEKSKCDDTSRTCLNTSGTAGGPNTREKTRYPNLETNQGCNLFQCPRICVECLEDCPVKRECPSPLEYCNNIDETCKRSKHTRLADFVDPCSDDNPCKCLGKKLGKPLIICPLVTDEQKCHQHCGWILNETMEECALETVDPPMTTADHPVILVSFFLPLGTILALYLMNFYFKQKAQKFHEASYSIVPDAAKPEKRMTEKQLGFRNHPGGTLVLALVILTCLWTLWMILVIILENANLYPYLALGDTTLGIFPNSNSSTNWFVFFWNLAFFWNLFVCLNKYNFKNKFRVPCALSDATFVGVWKNDPIQIIVPDTGRLKDMFEKYHRLKKKYITKGGKLVVCPVQVPESDNKSLTHSDLAMEAKENKNELMQRYFVYNLQRHIYDCEQKVFLCQTITVGNTNLELHSKLDGLTNTELQKLFQQIGPNEIVVEIPPLYMSIVVEFLAPLYLYQWSILWLWYWQYNWRVALPITGLIVLSGLILVFLTRYNAFMIRNLIQVEGTTTVKRNGKWKDIPHRELYPGDIVKVKNGVAGADLVLLCGTSIVDESMLTGEATPVQKISIPKEDIVYTGSPKNKKNMIFSGTPVTHVENDVIAIVVQTGANTEKGQLVRQILDPVPVRFKFNDHILLTYAILLCFGLSIAVVIALMMRAKKFELTSWFWGMWAVKQSIHPLLPTIFVLAESVAAFRLKMKQIIATQPNKITLAGKVRICCFDKTGTLTKQGLDYIGALPVDKGSSFLPLTSKMDNCPALMREGFSCCHSVSQPRGEGTEFIGNLVDVKLFETTGCRLHSHDNVRTIDHPTFPLKLEVLKQFQFDHHRMTMTVIIKRNHVDTNKFAIFTKGSFEAIKKLCIPSSIPDDYDEVASGQAKKGGYVLGLAYRTITADDVSALKADRNSCENNLNFLTLFTFQNQLKEDTSRAIHALKMGDCRPVMITGDNILTGVYIAKEAGLINSDRDKILYGSVEAKSEMNDIKNPSNSRKSELESLLTAEENGNVIWRTEEGEIVQLPDNIGEVTSTTELAVSGAVFRVLVNNDKLNRKLLQGIRVFARMTPQDKINCVHKHMELLGITSMCGDGGNDCGALRVAHVGLALSDSEASIVSPFTGQRKSVEEMVELILQGRAALANMFAAYRYMIMFTMITCIAKLINGFLFIEYSPISWVFLDLIYVLFLVIGVLASNAAVKLNNRRPTSSLFGATTVSSIGGATFINFMFMIGVVLYVYNQASPGEWLHCKQWDPSYVNLLKWWSLYWNRESQCILMVVVWQCINVAVIVNFGSVFRSIWCKNYVLIFFLLALDGLTLGALFDKDGDNYSCFFSVNCPYMDNQMPDEIRTSVFLLMISNLAALIIWETVVVIGPVGNHLRATYHKAAEIKI